MNNPVYVIGDIHGCYDQYLNIYNKIVDHQDTYKQSSSLVFVGDYIDRGPNSKRVLYSVRDLTGNTIFIDSYFSKVIALKGNHEDMLLHADDSRKDRRLFLNNGGYETLESFGYTDSFQTQPIKKIINDPTLWDWISNLPLFYVINNVAISHAGININKLPVDMHSEEELLWSRDLRTDKHDIHKFTVHGHTPMKNVFINENVAYIDTGCVFGGKLTCLFIPDTVNPDYNKMEIIQND